MRSLRTRITLLTVCVLIVTVVVVSITSVIFIKNNDQRKSNQLLLLLCETGEKNLDFYFNSTQKSVAKVANYVMADLDGLDDEHLGNHVSRVRKYFDEAASIFTMFYTKRIVRPLEQLTKAAEQVERGNYEFSLDYDKDDEVGRLTSTFRELSDHMKDHISTLNKKVFIDAMTKVKNKGAFSAALEELQIQADKQGTQMQFALGVFDCDDLKVINDIFGHDKGDEYLKTASRLICRIFRNSPVYRIGGDEFAVILRHEDYQNKDLLVTRFEEAVTEINSATENVWEQVHISYGIADYDIQNDGSVDDVMRRADKIMYENKRLHKKRKMNW